MSATFTSLQVIAETIKVEVTTLGDGNEVIIRVYHDGMTFGYDRISLQSTRGVEVVLTQEDKN